jgi:hypothetical protein
LRRSRSTTSFGIGRNGTGVLILQWGETSAGGRQDYQVPFKFTGKLNKLTLSVERSKLTL